MTTTAVTADADVRGAEDETVGDGRSGIMSPVLPVPLSDDAVTCTSDLCDSVLLFLSVRLHHHHHAGGRRCDCHTRDPIRQSDHTLTHRK